MNTVDDIPEGKEPHTPKSVVVVTLISALAVGSGIFWVMEMIFPSLKERWNVEPSFTGMAGAFVLFSVSALIIGNMRFQHAKPIAICSFIGLFIPWAFHVLAKIWEFARGGGI